MNQRPLTKAESDELRALLAREKLTLAESKRGVELCDQSLLYGDSTIEPRSFKGLAPRYSSS